MSNDECIRPYTALDSGYYTRNYINNMSRILCGIR